MIAAALAQSNAPFISNHIETHDADDHAACLRDWEQCYNQLSAGSFRGAFEEFCFGNVQLFREGFNQSAHESGMPWRGSRAVGVATALEGQGWFNGKDFRQDSIIDLAGGVELDFRTPKQHEIVVAVVNTEALHNYSLQVEHFDLSAQARSCGLIEDDPVTAEQLRAFLTTVFASLRATPQLLAHQQMRKALEQAIFSCLLDVILRPSNQRHPTSSKARQSVVERARVFIREHIEEPISVEDLCIHLGVSRRTLQYSFQDVLDLNPVKFLRAMRLNGVRRALKRANPQRDSVADIAAGWGFWHLSHFSAEYKKMFDELPSETLRRTI